MKQPSYLCSCTSCHKPFSSLGIDTHFMRSHGTPEQKNLFKQKTANHASTDYLKSPNQCVECRSDLLYSQRHNKFCSKKCSATYHNRKRENSGWTHSTETRSRIRDKLSIFSGPYSKVYFKTCKFCNQLFTTPNRNRVCKNCQHLKWSNNKDQYSFRFNVFDYPDLFDLDRIKSIGWVSFGGKRGGDKNILGLSRDHKVSVHDAKKFNYDPYYISHPLNCEIMEHLENMKKNTKSSLDYSELVKLVDQYDNRGDC